MGDTSSSARPRQVTMAAGLAVGGGLFLLFTVFETLGRLGSVRMREELAEALSSGSAAALGLGVEQLVSVMRASLWVAAVASAVAVVAGVFCFQRHRGARVALTVAAVPLLVTAPFTGGLLAVLVVAAAAMAWSGPARDWFAGRPVREQPSARREPSEGPPHERPQAPQLPDHDAARPTGPATTSVSTVATSSAPAPTQGYGAAQGERGALADPSAPGGPWSSTAPVADRPPAAVRTATLLTWIGCGLVLLGMVGYAVAYQVDPEPIRDEVMGNAMLDPTQVTPGLVTTAVWVSVALLGGWALAACALAVLVRRRHDWARWLLVVSAVLSSLLCLVSVIGVPIAIAGAVVVGMLLRPASRDWFAGRAPARQGPPQGPSQGPPPAQPRRQRPW